jgi:predicted permease
MDLLYRLRALFRRRTVEADLDDELRFHLERQAEKYRHAGLPPDEISRRLRLDFGGPDQIREECRDARGIGLLENGANDLRYALRTLRKSPVFAVTAIVTIALGIGASTAVFSVADAVLFRPLPYRDPDRLVVISRDVPGRNLIDSAMSNADFIDFRDATKTLFEDVAAIGSISPLNAAIQRPGGAPQQVIVQFATSNFLDMVGAKVILGRNFENAAQPSAPRPDVQILGYDFWQRVYGGDPSVVGRTGPTVAGVLDKGFELLLPPRLGIERKPDFWMAQSLAYDNAQRSVGGLRVIGRLHKGISLKQAQAGVDVVAEQFRSRFQVKASGGDVLRVKPMLAYVAAEARPAILALMGAAGFLLLIACANIANLLLVRTSLREREFSVRVALGGSVGRLARQIFAEALLLSAVGTTAGVGLAWLGIHVLQRIAPPNLPRLDFIAVDLRVLGLAALAGLGSAAIFSVGPALRASRPDLMQVLRGSGRLSGLATAGRKGVLRNTVLVTEVALSFVLLIGAGLMFRSFLSLVDTNLGYVPQGVLTFHLISNREFEPAPQRAPYLRSIQDRLSALPGVLGVASTYPLPLDQPVAPMRWGDAARANVAALVGSADVQIVLPSYFETLRTPLIEGRTFTQDDNNPARKVVVIDQLLAAKAFPADSAVGKQLAFSLQGAAAELFEVIGVVAHQRASSIAEPGSEQAYFTAGMQGYHVSNYWVVRTSGDPSMYAAAVRNELHSLDSRLIVTNMQPMTSLVDKAQASTRYALFLMGVFAAISIALAGIGLYGVLASSVRQRTAEIGLRMALGATPRGVFRLVAGQGLLLSTIGMALGVATALGLTRLMTSMLVGVRPTDPMTFAAMTVLFFLIAALASWLPARRAANLDPAITLRED